MRRHCALPGIGHMNHLKNFKNIYYRHRDTCYTFAQNGYYTYICKKKTKKMKKIEGIFHRLVEH